MPSTINHVMLPPIYFLSEVGIALLCRCFDNKDLLNSTFKIEELSKVAVRVGINETQQTEVFEELLHLEVIYSLSKQSKRTKINPELNYYLNAERMVQALISRFSDYVTGKRLCKFEIDGEIIDGGFVENNSELFTAIMSRTTEYLASNDSQEDNSQEIHLPSFVRIYECIGTADGRDFFTKRSVGSHITTEHADIFEPIFNIPKYVMLNKQEREGTWIRDHQRMCVCIS